MQIDTFLLERTQSLWENRVRYNLTESGVHPFTLRELLDPDEIDSLLDLRLGYGHTEGTPELRTAVAALYPDTGPDDILVTNGSSEANFILAWTLLEPGDELVFMLPNFMQLPGIAAALGIPVRTFALREERGWALDPDELRAAVTSRTKLIAVCNPNNPTGAILGARQMDQLVAAAESVGAYLLSDEVYRGSELDGVETPSFRGRYEKAIAVGGLSKSLAHPGLRIGWMAAPPEVAAAALERQDYVSIGTGILNQRIAAAILRPDRLRRILERNRAMLNDNLGVVQRWVRRHGNRMSFVPPRAGGMAFVRYDAPVNSTLLSTRLREAKSVFVVPGDCFGMDGYLRIGIGAERAYLEEALALVDEVLPTLFAAPVDG